MTTRIAVAFGDVKVIIRIIKEVHLIERLVRYPWETWFSVLPTRRT